MHLYSSLSETFVRHKYIILPDKKGKHLKAAQIVFLPNQHPFFIYVLPIYIL